MKPSILIDARKKGSSWIGGIYYLKNIVFQLISNPKILANFNIIIYTYRENFPLFSLFGKKVKIVPINEKLEELHIEKVFRLLLCEVANVKYVFPSSTKSYKKLGITSVAWIPDFQHNKLPDMFRNEDIESRNRQFANIANSDYPLILSSNSCLDDFRKYYSVDKTDVYVVPFVSYIEEEILSITDEYVNEVLERNGLLGSKYVYIGNQFWKHKNHKFVLQAISRFYEKNVESTVKFVFTGELSDYRNPEYIEELKSLFCSALFKDRVFNLGFVDRKEQIAIIKNAEYLIQPSLFEGWGTVLEDAKVLDKTVLLSDIVVHREQRNEKCILFNPYDIEELSRLIELENSKKHTDSIAKGINDLHLRALEYSKGFEKLLFKDSI